ncbi:RNA 2',3'-cyclic phosphodiesterase [Metaplanococcus flavidus]|uniref:RNA 2',3'-cyclic phosphodiesterase n=1 Tax=Metaplanococcus flavidus TaxID=569883 RepID=A0ABW3L9W6_9BACL
MENHYFIGIKVPLQTSRSLAEQRNSWGLLSHKRIPVAEDLHITLVFIGGDPQGEIDAAADALEQVEQAPFDVTITGTGYFGKPERPRVVYAAIEENVLLNELQKKIKQALSGFRWSPDNKPFVPHITLANKWTAKEAWTEIPALEPERFGVTEFCLFRIEPGSTPRYVAIKTYKLKDGV